MPIPGSKVRDNRMVGRWQAVGRFAFLAQIQQKVETRSGTGSLTYTWAPIRGMEAIPCQRQDGPNQEIRSEFIIEENQNKFLLAGYYPAITPDSRLLLNTGELFDIIGVSSDPTIGVTTVQTRQVTPTAEPGV
jgi:hypothetical protein